MTDEERTWTDEEKAASKKREKEMFDEEDRLAAQQQANWYNKSAEERRRIEREQGENERLAELLTKARAHYYTGKENMEGDHAAAQWLIGLRNVKTDILGKIHAYDSKNGFYRVEGDIVLKADMLQAFGKLANRTRIGEVLARVAALSYCDETRLLETIPPNLIPLENGVYDLTTKRLLPHSPEYFFTYKHPITYAPDAQCPMVQKFLGEIVTNGHEKEILLDIAALCLYRARITRHFFILVGAGHNGKSVYLNLLRSFIGPSRCVSITPQALATDVFAPAQLHNKHANLGADIPGGLIRDVTIVKTATGGDAVSVQRKGVDRDERELYCEFVWASNTPPRIGEDTYAIWDRLIVITFPYAFIKEPTKPNEKQAIKGLEQQLCTPQELSGLFNAIIDNLEFLKENRALRFEPTPESVRKDYRTLSDTPAVFVDEACEEVEYDPGDTHEGPSGFISADEAYKAYKAWCKTNKVNPVTANRFGRAMEDLGFERGRDNRSRSYRGLQLVTMVTIHPILRSTTTRVENSIEKSLPSFISVTEEKVENLPQETPWMSKTELLEAIRQLGTPTYGDVLKLYPGESIIEQWILELKRDGEIYEPTSGKLKVI